RLRDTNSRNSSASTAPPTIFSGDARPGGTGLLKPGVVTVGTLANGTWLSVIVSRGSCSPAAVATALRIAVACAAGIDLSRTSATLTRLTAPGATVVFVIVLLTPKSVVPVECL